MLGLAGVVAAFSVFASEFTSRVANNLWNDPAFSGWCSAVGHELASGKVLYRDVTLPMPPGSFVLLMWIERAWGHGPRMLQENVVCAFCYALLALLGYAIAKPIAGRRVALFCAATTLGWACIWIKELAYDALAEVVAWTAIALLVRAWTGEPGARERRWLLAAGLAAGATLIFKQSTALGVFTGALSGLAYLAWAERRDARALRARLRGAATFSAGAGLGFALCVALVASSGSPVTAFLRAVFVDGVALKGGRAHLVLRTTLGLALQPVMLSSVGLALVFAALVFRVARRERGLAFGGAPAPALRERDVAGVVALGALVFGCAAALLAGKTRLLLPSLAVAFVSPSLIVLGSGLAVAFFFGNLGASAREPEGRAFNAAALAALVLASTVSTSMTSFNPFYENNAMMIIVLVALFTALERTAIRGLSWVGLAVMMGQPLAWRVPRALAATHAAPASSFFAGMRVDNAGRDVVRIAERVRALAGARGTVLTLPEDPSLATLIGRSRPDLCGAIVFSDQYPRRCVEHDSALLDEQPPDVLVLRPANRKSMRAVLRIWDPHSPTEALVTRFLDAHLADYARVATYRTRWLRGTNTLEIWAHRGAAR